MKDGAFSARHVSPAEEASRYAASRSQEPATGYTKVLHVGDVVRVYHIDGTVLTGCIARVSPAVDGGFVIDCGPFSG